MKQTTLIDALGIGWGEIEVMRDLANLQSFGDKARLARLGTAKRTEDVAVFIAEQLWACKQILSAVGLYKSIGLVKGMVESGVARQPNWDEILEKIYSDPTSFRNPVIWLFFHACLQAERDFALDVCCAHSREDVLTGRLLEGIKGACTSWGKASAAYLRRVEDVLEVSSIDLTVGGGEQETGGDFALILDIKEKNPTQSDLDPSVVALTGGPRGDIFVPLLFQAKCYAGLRADISQKHSERGYQFNRLRQVNCAANYIFYENAKEKINLPALPMVKPVSDCKPVELSKSTDVFSRSINFASYVLRAANGFDSIPVAQTREDALNMILANTSPNSVTKIAILGNTSGLDKIYRDALQQLRDEIDNEIRLGSAQDDLDGDQRTSGFKP